MARRNKLSKFADLLTFTNVVENFDALDSDLVLHDGVKVDFKGSWAAQFYHNALPITLELACGRGEYTLALSRAFPNRNFLGVDIKGARIWKGAKTALKENLNNAAFLRTRIEIIEKFFQKGEIDEIWITFPDPFHGKENRRLTAPRFLDRYRYLLKPGGYVNLKTDDDELFEYSVDSVNQCSFTSAVYINDNIYSQTLAFPELDHKTYYEVMHLAKAKTIKYLRFQVN